MNYWLMKAEPNSRLEKGKEVKFSVDDFEAVKVTPWEGVRNHEAKKLMQTMKVGDQVLFYHSNCKEPGVAGFAEVSKEAYPDYTAWDPSHPYFDPKTNKDAPKWFMVDLTFKSRAEHFVPLSLIKRIASLPLSSTPAGESDIASAAIGEAGVEAIKRMALVNRGRLSVQPVTPEAWSAIQILSETARVGEISPKKTTKASASSNKAEDLSERNDRPRKRKNTSKSEDTRDRQEGTRRSTRIKRE